MPKPTPLMSMDEIRKMAESDNWTSRTDPNKAARTIRVNEARASNVKALQKSLYESPEAKWHRESFRKQFGFDFMDRKKLPVQESGFSWQSIAKKLGAPNVDMCLKEAQSSSTFVQVLRAGIQQVVNSAYETVATTFESWVTTVNSTKDTEPYAPLHGVGFLREVGKQEIYSEAPAAGLDLKLKNRKFGEIFAVEKELLEDDQTGQFAKQAGLLGEYCKIAVECYVYAKLAGTGGTYAQLVVPSTETKPSYEANYPFAVATAPFRGGGSNRPATYAQLAQAGVQAAFIGLMNQLNLLGLKMNVDPNRLVVGPQNRFNAAMLLNSSFYPSVPSGTAGAVGGTFAINPIESIAALTISRFMFDQTGAVTGNSQAWYLMDDTKPFFVLQMRQAAEVVQENPAAGQSFDRDVIRFKVSTRFNCDYIDPRFVWQGDDGSV